MIKKQIVFASHNAGKIKEVADILAPLEVAVLSADEVDLTDVEETGKTFEENAILKATAAAKASGLPAIADDSGLCVHALNDSPGVYTARFAQKCGGYEQAFADILKSLENKEDKSAHFICTMAYALPNGTVKTYTGRIDGSIVAPQKGKNGFGFDPIFMPRGFDKTFNALPMEQKNTISHRALALAAFLKDFKELV